MKIFYEIIRSLRWMVAFTVFGLAMSGLPRHASGQFLSLSLDEPPLRYSETPATNRVSQLAVGIKDGSIQLERDHERGYLRALLKHLRIPESSQVLVFSKTSLQVQHISPRNPRAIYFNDDTYVGWIPGSSLIEISTNDPKLGAAFYSVEMSLRKPKIRQETYQCLACHATSMTQGIPGHTVRSGYPNYDGRFDLKRASFVTDETSDFKERWGGWYVSGSHGEMQHLGNTYLRSGVFDSSANGNRERLDEWFNVAAYLTPHSDIQALMVMEHQTQMHNTITRADMSVRVILYDNHQQDQTELDTQIAQIAKTVVDRLLFCNEYRLTSPVVGTSGFEKDFLDSGPKDGAGRSLRQFEMQTRMFRYPLSYLIYSEAMDSMHPLLREEVVGQLKAVLEGYNRSAEYQHIDQETRQSILEIVKQTKPGFFD